MIIYLASLVPTGNLYNKYNMVRKKNFGVFGVNLESSARTAYMTDGSDEMNRG